MRRLAAFVVALTLGIVLTPSLQVFAQVDSASQSREQLEKELSDLEAQIKSLQGSITQTQAQKDSLARDITLLSQKIAQSKLKIKQHDATIGRLNQNITEKNKNINVLDSKMEREKDSLAQIMRKTKYMEQYSLLDFGLQTQSLSTFFSDADSFNTLNKALNQSFADIRATKAELEEAKTELQQAKDDETQQKLAQEAEKKKVENNQAEKNTLLTQTKNQEAAYKKVLADRQAEAAKIRARLFDLRDVTAISFGDAYDLAVIASKSTNVRPALILAILQQESSLGTNVGACYLRDYNTGDGVSIKTAAVKPRTMSPTRDVPVFLTLTQSLGRDPRSTPVSCWIAAYSGGQPSGWGGAMGPSQFIPSTWKLFQSRITGITGKSIADPWNPRDAITATALYLKDLGAISGNESAERNAACKYYSGRSCASSSAGATYGNSVIKKMYSVQADIDKLSP
jgi:membrane-bound lytic murein transglycosylase B